MNIVEKEFQYGDQQVKLETGRIAKQATGSVMVTMGNTMVLCTVVGAKTARPGQAFFPLTVNYQERPTPRARSPGVSSAVKDVQARKRRLPAGLSIARSDRFSRKAS